MSKYNFEQTETLGRILKEKKISLYNLFIYLILIVKEIKFFVETDASKRVKRIVNYLYQPGWKHHI